MSTPAVDPEGAPQSFDEEVIAATARLANSAYHVEKQFDDWVDDVFDTFDAEEKPAANTFYRSLLNTPELSKVPGIRDAVGLRAWVARRLADDLARGEQSTLREFLPYPAGVSEQQRQALHRIWLGTLSNGKSGDFELVHVVPYLVAGALSMSMRVHHPFDAPQDIGPAPRAGAVRHQVVFWKGAYHRLLPFDPADPRLDSGFPQTTMSANAKERLDALFNDVINLLKPQIASAEAESTNRHKHILQAVFHRNLAAIRKQPVSPRRQAKELVEHRRYFNSLQEDSGWQDESPRLESPFTLRLTAGGEGRGVSSNLWLGGKTLPVLNTARLVAPGDMVSVDFGKVGGQGVGIARIPYTTADGIESSIYQELGRKFDDNELAELRNRASVRVLEPDKPPFSDSFRMVTVAHEYGVLVVRFSADGATRRTVISRVEFADGIPAVIPRGPVVLEVGYGVDSQPLAVAEIPAEPTGGKVLYLRLTDPAPTARDIERLRLTESFWELRNRWTLFDGVSFDDTFWKNAKIPEPVDKQVGGPGKTIDGLEVDLSAGAAINLQVGTRLVGPDIVNNVFVVVKAPLMPLDDEAVRAFRLAHPLAEVPTHAYRLVNTGKPAAEFGALIEKLQKRKERRERAAAGPAAKRRRTGGGLPGGPAAFEWAGAASADGGVGSSSGWAAGVEPSVVWVDGGWRVSYRSAEGLPSWGEMTRVESDRFTWQGRAPLEFVPTPGDEGGRPFRVVTAGEQAGVRVHVDHWVQRGESGTVVFRLRLVPDANVAEDAIRATLGAVEQWVVQTNAGLGSQGGSQAVAVVFDPAAETVVRLSRYDSDLKDSHNVYVSGDGAEGRITQLHWLAGLPSRAYGHEL
ncbi:hypothetical protein, partial [Micromonospora sp. MH33]|uniref:hypothetical protein n=1 Tax=Micromonospora sp. MH33 TaxID=1945509 RepID=UPI001AEFAE6D